MSSATVRRKDQEYFAETDSQVDPLERELPVCTRERPSPFCKCYCHKEEDARNAQLRTQSRSSEFFYDRDVRVQSKDECCEWLFRVYFGGLLTLVAWCGYIAATKFWESF